MRGEARREELAEELRELHAVLWSLANVPERSSKMLDEFTGPMRRAEARAEKAARDVEAQTTLALKLKSWLRNLTEKLATVDVRARRDFRCLIFGGFACFPTRTRLDLLANQEFHFGIATLPL